jgi:membrane-associated phospholipid phosphatase
VSYTLLEILTKMLQNNRTFFLLFFIFLISGGILLANMEQGDDIRFFSEHRSLMTNSFFIWITKVGEGLTYIFLMVFFLLIRYRYSVLVLVAGALAMGVSFILKITFSHPRPSVYFREKGELDELNIVEGVHLISGHMSFPSGHTTSAFVLFGLLALLFARKWYWNASLFFLALLIGISRIYLVQHFFKDVYTGAITGVFLAVLVYGINERFPYNDSRWIDRSLLWKKRDQV